MPLFTGVGDMCDKSGGAKRRQTGICPECNVRNGDSSEKELFRCPHCGRLLCNYHLEPKPAFIRNLKVPLTETDVLIQKESSKGGIHASPIPK
jgi:transcription initiation factor IIE alpha subunit